MPAAICSFWPGVEQCPLTADLIHIDLQKLINAEGPEDPIIEAFAGHAQPVVVAFVEIRLPDGGGDLAT